MDHFACDANVFMVEFYGDPCPTLPVLEIYLIPETRPEFAFSARFTPMKNQSHVCHNPSTLYHSY